MTFYLYKGLKKPLVFFGLKDKYIYYGIGCAAVGIIGMIALPSLIGFIGLIIAACIGGGSLWYTYHAQKTFGLYNKQRNHEEIHVFPKRKFLKKR
jgi:hypothetical protein